MNKVVGLISPSAPITANCPRRLKRSIEQLEELGFEVKKGEHISEKTDFTAGTIEQRVEDIHDMFSDPEVDIIISTIGGYNANDLLEYLDYDLIKKNNDKLFVGYSDVTVLLQALHEFANVQAIYGPMALPQFGEYGGILSFTKESFLEIINNINTGKKYSLPVSDEFTEEFLLWDEDDNRERKMEENTGWYIASKGKSKGVLKGGNFRTLMTLAGTKYFPDLSNSILFLEDDADESSATLQRMLIQLSQQENFSELEGLVFGRFQEDSNISLEAFSKIIKRTIKNYDIPVIANVDFGHTDPILSLPIGKKVKVDTNKKDITITL